MARKPAATYIGFIEMYPNVAVENLIRCLLKSVNQTFPRSIPITCWFPHMLIIKAANCLVYQLVLQPASKEPMFGGSIPFLNTFVE